MKDPAPTQEPTSNPASQPAPAGFADVLDSLLKNPAEIGKAISGENSNPRFGFRLAAIATASLLAYGIILGSLSGGLQFLAAPLKLCLGMYASAAICLPSLYIFLCLSGAEITFRATWLMLVSMIAIVGLLLVGLGPVAWVFSQSTSSLVSMGFLHLLFWCIAVHFGMRLLFSIFREMGTHRSRHVCTWLVLFIAVCLQMSTTLRPLLGRSDQVFATEKKFFLVHWLEQIYLGSEPVKETSD